jgi:calmodulin
LSSDWFLGTVIFPFHATHFILIEEERLPKQLTCSSSLLELHSSTVFQPIAHRLIVCDLQWQEAFMIYDPESTGYISTTHCAEAARALGCNPDEFEIQDILVQLTGGGQCTYDTFCQIMMQLDDGGSTVDELKAAFRQFDRDGKGMIPGGELKYILENMGSSVRLEVSQSTPTEAACQQRKKRT